MSTYDLIKKQYGVSGESKVYLGGSNYNQNDKTRLQNLENKLAEQSIKLDKITALLNKI